MEVPGSDPAVPAAGSSTGDIHTTPRHPDPATPDMPDDRHQQQQRLTVPEHDRQSAPVPSAPEPSPLPSPALFRRSTMRRSMAPFVPESAGSESSSDTGQLARNSRPRRSVRFGGATVAPSPVRQPSVIPAAATPDPAPATPPTAAAAPPRTDLPDQAAAAAASPPSPLLNLSAALDAEPEDSCGLLEETPEQRSGRVGGLWPHGPCFLAASLSCTIGIFDICRVAYLSFQYGGGFVLQFLMLTIVFGLPLFSFQMTLGQYMGAGLMDMWRASPIFKGVGISAMMGMSLIGVYNVVPVSWMFVYFRDAFVTNLTFKWGECNNVHTDDECKSYAYNSSDILRLSIPAYYQKRVLQRGPQPNSTNMMDSAELVFENVFNMAVIWMIVFICLSKGIKSYGKVVLAFGIFPVVSFYLIAIEILRRSSTGAEVILSYQTDLKEFFLNGWSWLAAAREVFFIWGINGAVLMQIASHNKFNHNLKRDCAINILVTLSIFLLAAFLGCANVFIIYKMNPGQQFVPSSFETLMSSRFLAPLDKQHQDVGQFMSINYLLGVESTSYSSAQKVSGYQVARYATELNPMAMVALGPKRISAFWPVLFYLCLITFGVARQLAIWRCVVEGFLAVCPEKLRPWETSITFLACIFGFLLGLPFATQVGIYAVHFMDVCVGSAWWIMLVYLVQIFALLLIRGRPYSGDDIVLTLMDTQPMRKWLAPIVSFSWNIVLPVTLLVLSIASFKLGNFGRMFSLGGEQEYEYWPGWAKQIGAFIQIVPIVIMPLVALVQAVRYLGDKRQGNMSQKIERLIRPSPSSLRRPRESADTDSNLGLGSPTALGTLAADAPTTPRDDPPPKYTPPPSYNTATGLKLLKSLNSSFRSSVRRARAAISRTGVWGTGPPLAGLNTSTTAADVEMQTPIVERRASEETTLSLDASCDMASMSTTITTVDEDVSLSVVPEVTGSGVR